MLAKSILGQYQRLHILYCFSFGLQKWSLRGGSVAHSEIFWIPNLNMELFQMVSTVASGQRTVYDTLNLSKLLNEQLCHLGVTIFAGQMKSHIIYEVLGSKLIKKLSNGFWTNFRQRFWQNLLKRSSLVNFFLLKLLKIQDPLSIYHFKDDVRFS